MERKISAEEYVSMINKALEKYLYPIHYAQPIVSDAMRYSVRNGGKRVRPMLVLEFCRINGGNPEDALPFACALEMIHTYSLIHDDLPCMDDDDMRRGKPSCHKAFGEDTALLAGDALLTLAFETAAKANENIAPKNVIRAISALANFAGIDGMIGGQVLDLAAEKQNPDLASLRQIHLLKTAALIKAAAVLGCLAANVTDEKKLDAATKYAENIGVAFQIIDDILDVTSDLQTLGKPVGSDAKNEKTTYVTLLGLADSKNAAEKLTAEAVEALTAFDSDTEFLADYAVRLSNRNK